MDPGRRMVWTTTAIGVAAIAHAVLTWPNDSTVVLFVGGGTVAFTAEVIATSRGWVTHHLHPQLGGVPVYTIFGWVTVIYAAFRLVLLATTAGLAVVGTTVLATGFDVLTDHYGVEAGYWTYTDAIPGPRVAGVPWWNFLGWAAITGATTGMTVVLT